MKFKRFFEGLDLDDVKESVVVCKYVFFLRERCCLLFGLYVIDFFEVNKDDVLFKKGGVYFLFFYFEFLNFCENNVLKVVKGEMLVNCED